MFVLLIHGEFRTLRADDEGFAHETRRLLDVLTRCDEQWTDGAITIEERDRKAAETIASAPTRPLDYRELLSLLRHQIRDHERTALRVTGVLPEVVVSDAKVMTEAIANLPSYDLPLRSAAKQDQIVAGTWRPPWEESHPEDDLFHDDVYGPEESEV